MDNKDFYINVGPLNSLSSLHYHIGKELPDLRAKVARGGEVIVKFDMTNIAHERINILTLISFLSLSRKIAITIGEPIELLIKWEPKILGFLSDIGFFVIAKKLSIFKWDERMVGGYSSGKTNPNTKILYFADVQKILPEDYDELSSIKNFLKQRIAPNFIVRCGNILKDFDTKLVNTISNTTLELIVNSLIHGGDIAFVGLQRSTKRISISVADSGIGFKNSLSRYSPELFGKEIDNSTALIFGSLIQKKQHGLKLAITELLKNHNPFSFSESNNWILISSFDTEINWRSNIWEVANEKFEQIPNNKREVQKLCNDLISDYGKDFVKKHSTYLVGSRITFEIPLNPML